MYIIFTLVGYSLAVGANSNTIVQIATALIGVVVATIGVIAKRDSIIGGFMI